jgi:hypothetical protein
MIAATLCLLLLITLELVEQKVIGCHGHILAARYREKLSKAV